MQKIAGDIVDLAAKRYTAAPNMNVQKQQQLVDAIIGTLVSKDFVTTIEQCNQATMDEFIYNSAVKLSKEGVIHQKAGRKNHVSIDTGGIDAGVAASLGEGKNVADQAIAVQTAFYEEVVKLSTSIYPETKDKLNKLVENSRKHGDSKESPAQLMYNGRNKLPEYVKDQDPRRPLKEIQASDAPKSPEAIYHQALDVFKTQLDAERYPNKNTDIPHRNTFEGRKFIIENEMTGTVYSRIAQLVTDKNPDSERRDVQAYGLMLDQTHLMIGGVQGAPGGMTAAEKQTLIDTVEAFQVKLVESCNERYPGKLDYTPVPVSVAPNAFKTELESFEKGLNESLDHLVGDEKTEMLAVLDTFMHPERLIDGDQKDWNNYTKIQHLTEQAVATAGKETEEGKQIQEIGGLIARMERKGLRVVDDSKSMIVQYVGGAFKPGTETSLPSSATTIFDQKAEGIKIQQFTTTLKENAVGGIIHAVAAQAENPSLEGQKEHIEQMDKSSMRRALRRAVKDGEIQLPVGLSKEDRDGIIKDIVKEGFSEFKKDALQQATLAVQQEKLAEFDAKSAPKLDQEVDPLVEAYQARVNPLLDEIAASSQEGLKKAEVNDRSAPDYNVKAEFIHSVMERISDGVENLDYDDRAQFMADAMTVKQYAEQNPHDLTVEAYAQEMNLNDTLAYETSNAWLHNQVEDHVVAHSQVMSAAPLARRKVGEKWGYEAGKQELKTLRDENPDHPAWEALDQGLKANREFIAEEQKEKPSSAFSLAGELAKLRDRSGLKNVLNATGINLDSFEKESSGVVKDLSKEEHEAKDREIREREEKYGKVDLRQEAEKKGDSRAVKAESVTPDLLQKKIAEMRMKEAVKEAAKLEIGAEKHEKSAEIKMRMANKLESSSKNFTEKYAAVGKGNEASAVDKYAGGDKSKEASAVKKLNAESNRGEGIGGVY